MEASCEECDQLIIYSETWGWIHVEPPIPPGHAAVPPKEDEEGAHTDGGQAVKDSK